jgi:hypothetical protein
MGANMPNHPHPVEARVEAAKERAEERAKGERPNGEKGPGDGNQGQGGAGAGDHPGMGMGMGHRGEVRELIQEVRAGKLSKDEFKAQLAALDKDRAQRRAQHQAEIQSRWGRDLGRPPMMDELRRHARREAFLNRMMVVAQTERSGKDQQKLIDRIEAMSAREDAHHDKRMAEIKAAADSNAPGAAPAGSAAPATAPAASANAQGGAQ